MDNLNKIVETVEILKKLIEESDKVSYITVYDNLNSTITLYEKSTFESIEGFYEQNETETESFFHYRKLKDDIEYLWLEKRMEGDINEQII